MEDTVVHLAFAILVGLFAGYIVDSTVNRE